MCAPLVKEADDSTLPDQQQHSSVRLTSWWLNRSIWQTLGFTWTHRLCCNLSSALTDVASIGKAGCQCVWERVIIYELSHLRTLWAQLCSHGFKRQSLSSGWESKKPEQAQQECPFHRVHNNHPAPENTVPGLPSERTTVTVCRARGRDESMCPFVSSDWWTKKRGGKKKAKTDKTYKTIIPHSLHSWHIFWEAISCKNSDTGIMMALIGPHLTGGTSCSFVLVSLWEDGVGGGWSGRGRVWGKQLLEMTQSRTSLWPPTLAHNAHTFAHITTSHIGRPVNVGACRFFCWWPS